MPGLFANTTAVPAAADRKLERQQVADQAAGFVLTALAGC